MKNSFCPECRQVLKNRNVCNCGWREVETQETDHFCHYRSSNRRCKNLGTVCNSPSGKKWYCSSHFSVLGDVRLCEAVLLESEGVIQSS
ncbi:MAG TPA: hypothetical protein VLI69_00020 [Gammaproteobacteria bacterium]|nr:hypothetical protein [Gammaproteobacteria bacterium]